MIKQLFLLAFSILVVTCSKDDQPMMDLEPLNVVRIDGFVSTSSSTFQVTNLLNNSVTTNIQVTSPFLVEFSKPVLMIDLMNESLPRLLKTDNGEPVAGVTINVSIPSNRELALEPLEALEPGTTYQLVINPGYEAEDGGVLDEHAIVNFVTAN